MNTKPDLTSIKRSNVRVWSAIILCRCVDSGFAARAELRDALRQRGSMRASLKFSLWFSENELMIRERFNIFRARHRFMFSSGSVEKDFADFVTGEYIKDNGFQSP